MAFDFRGRDPRSGAAALLLCCLVLSASCSQSPAPQPTGSAPPSEVTSPPGAPVPAPPPPMPHTPEPQATGALRHPEKPAHKVEVQPSQPPAASDALKGSDQALDRLAEGSAVLTAPTEVPQYQSFTVTLVLAAEGLETLTRQVRAASSGAESLDAAAVRLSPAMSAELTSVGNPLVIQPSGKQTQLVGSRGETTWTWTVSSDTIGPRVLKATLYADMRVNGQSIEKGYKAGTLHVGVHFSPAGWAGRNWQWLFSSLLLPLIGFIGQRWFRRGDAKGGAGRDA